MAADAQHSSAGILALLQDAPGSKDLVYQGNAVLNSFDDQYVALMDAAKLAEALRDAAKVAELRTQLELLVQTHDKLQQHTRALAALKSSYQCTAAATDFKAKLQVQGLSPALAAELDKQLKLFDRAVWNVHHAGQPMEGEGDDELWVDSTQQTAPNAKCPISGRALLDLVEPVKDKHGYVYEKEAVVQYINSKKGSAPNPNAGVGNKITLADLAPAKEVMRMIKRKQLASQQGRASGAHDDAEVIE